MPRGGKNHAQGEGKSLRGGKIFARALRAQDSIFLPPLANFSFTPLNIIHFLINEVTDRICHILWELRYKM